MFRITKRGKKALQWDGVTNSEDKTAYDSGSQRDSQVGKGRFDLIPTSALRRLAQHFENGAKKYSERNWEKGQPLSQYYNSAMRHLMAIQECDLSEDHAAAAMWNIAAIIHHIDAILNGDLPRELDDFGIIAEIEKQQEPEQKVTTIFAGIGSYAYPSRAIASGVYDDSLAKAFDKDRFPNNNPPRYKTGKLEENKHTLE